MTTLTLYQIAQEYRHITDVLMNSDADEQTIKDTLEGEAWSLECKAQNYGFVIRNLEATAESIKQAEADMAARRKSIENRADYLRERLKTGMEIAGVQKLECPYFVASIRKNPPSVDVFEPALIPSEFMLQPAPPPPAPDKTVPYVQKPKTGGSSGGNTPIYINIDDVNSNKPFDKIDTTWKPNRGGRTITNTPQLYQEQQLQRVYNKTAKVLEQQHQYNIEKKIKNIRNFENKTTYEKNKIIKEIYEETECGDNYELYIDGECALIYNDNISLDSPEDLILCREMSILTEIKNMMRLAYNAGARGEQFVVDSERIEEG